MVDLSGGANAKNFPVRYTDEAPDLSDDTCRTTELWLRWVPAGSFAMGSDPGVPGRNSEREMPRHNVTLTRGYYVGVFECTQKQWELVMGSQISNMRIGVYAPVRPVGQVSYELLRGSSDWPQDGHAVDESSFMGRIRAKTGLLFDLPTEAQWEYACRARTTTGLNSGVELTTPYQADPAMDALGRYLHNGGGVTDGYQTSAAVATAPVGSYQPNAWGLYDMHGNLWKWCLDWWQPNAVGDTMADAVNPSGPSASTGNGRVLRGGGFTNYAAVCRAPYQFNKEPTYGAGNLGFRLVCLPQ